MRSPYDVLERIYQVLLARTTINLTPMMTDPADYPRGLPFLRIVPESGMDTEDSAQSGTVWTFDIHAGWEQNFVQRDEAWLHADANLEGSLHWAIKKLPLWLKNEMWVMLDSEFVLDEQQMELGPKVVRMWHFSRKVSVEIPAGDRKQVLLPVTNHPAYPPELSDMDDIWGIATDEENDVLFLTQGHASTQAEAYVHRINLTDNSALPDLTAGAAAGAYRRGLDFADGHLFVVDDQTTRGTWTLVKIDVGADTVVATAGLGGGEFTGVSIYGDNNEYVTVAEIKGAGTFWRVYSTADLSRLTDQEDADTVTAGYAAGVVDIGRYYYDTIGQVAMANDGSGRRADLDVVLPGVRTQWRGATRRKNYLWAAGVSFASGEPAGLIGASMLPSEVSDYLESV